MNDKTSKTDTRVLDAQREHWQTTFTSRPEMFGAEPSYAARKATELFRKERKRKVLELGCGQGRDTLFLAGSGFDITALDYSEWGLQDVRAKAQQAGLSSRLTTACIDIRKPLPFNIDTFEACFSHMLYCMALTTAEAAVSCQPRQATASPTRIIHTHAA